MTNKKKKETKLKKLIDNLMEKKSIVPTLAEISAMARDGEKLLEEEKIARKKEFEGSTTEQKYQKAYNTCYAKLTTEEKKIVDSKKEGRVLTTFINRVIVLTEDMIEKEEKEHQQ